MFLLFTDPEIGELDGQLSSYGQKDNCYYLCSLEEDLGSLNEVQSNETTFCETSRSNNSLKYKSINNKASDNNAPSSSYAIISRRNCWTPVFLCILLLCLIWTRLSLTRGLT